MSGTSTADPELTAPTPAVGPGAAARPPAGVVDDAGVTDQRPAVPRPPSSPPPDAGSAAAGAPVGGRAGSRAARAARELEIRRSMAGPPMGRVPALDGLRGIAVAAVVAYHFGVAKVHGGLLGVDVFFVLSGFLITTLLIDEWCATGRIDLRKFWARRARRLLPAVLLVVVAVAAYAAFVADPADRGRLRADAFSTLGYVANWHFALSGQGYFDQLQTPSPLLHTWSLAVEEQFYLVWPLLAVAALRRGHHRLLQVAAGGAALSALTMCAMSLAGVDASRMYYGTDTRAQALLIGGVLAATRPRRMLVAKPMVRRGFGLLGFAGLVGLAIALVEVDGQSSWLYRGGFALVALAVAAIVAIAVGNPRGVIARVLGVGPLRKIGEISYGIYLWHWPIELVLTRDRLHVGGVPLLVVRIMTTVGMALLSYELIEQPIRQRTLFRRPSRSARPAATWQPRVAAIAACAACIGLVLAGTVGPAPKSTHNLDLTFAARGQALAGGAPAAPAPTPESSAAAAAAAPAPPPPQYAPLGRKAKVVLAGDSLAFTLGYTLGPILDQEQIGFTLDGQLGCGVVAGEHYDRTQKLADPDYCKRWEAKWRNDVAKAKPDVFAILIGRWEMTTRWYDGAWRHLGDPVFDAYVRKQLELAVSIAGSGGGRVVFLSTPCMKEPEQADGSPWPQDDPARLARFHQLEAQVAAEDPSKVSVYDFDALLCPNGQFQKSVDGVTVRSADGVHFTPDGAVALGKVVLPALRHIAEQLPHLGTATSTPVTSTPATRATRPAATAGVLAPS